MIRLGDLFSMIGGRLRALPTGGKVVLAVAALAVLAVGSVFMYRTYDFVQHDNQFCLECHLMRDPFERFAQSAHRGLGCKACHRPNIIERSQMGLAQIVEQPDSIRVHAHVSNRICAECHIDGDPEAWLRVANTAGHRIHLESDHPSLESLACVECHSSGVHQFTPTDRTCGQGGCHESTTIQLGRMGDMTIHCATCHDFAAPVAAAATETEVASSLQPRAEECLSCHQMRTLLADFPPDEPHEAACGACHNPHSQATPREAVASCASGGCHDRPERLTPFHRGLNVGVLEDCLACHTAHEFRIHGGGRDCLACHTDIYQDAPPTGAGRPVASSHATQPGAGSIRLAASDDGDGAWLPALARARHGLPSQDTLAFWHAQHRGVECTQCHDLQGSHGALLVTSIRDCRACHHTEPVAADCTRCHARQQVAAVRTRLTKTLDLRIGRLNRPVRQLPFDHARHMGFACTSCHTGGVELSAAAVACADCHEAHHRPEARCIDCHAEPADGAHGLEVHSGCAGSGCHETMPASIRDVPRTRSFCLACHRDQIDHQAPTNCVNCHTLPRPRSARADAAAARYEEA